MGELQETQRLHVDEAQNGCCRTIMEDCEASMESSMEFSSANSEASSSLEMVEDALSTVSNSSLSSSSSSSSNGPLFELSELMVHLPMK